MPDDFRRPAITLVVRSNRRLLQIMAELNERLAKIAISQYPSATGDQLGKRSQAGKRSRPPGEEYSERYLDYRGGHPFVKEALGARMRRIIAVSS